jgi:hypothetical protein
MWSSKGRRAAAAVIGIGCVTVATGTTGAVAAPHSHGATTKHHPKGFYVATQKSTMRVTPTTAPAGVVDDPSGTAHVVTIAKSAADSTQGHIVYYTHAHGQKWKSHKVPGTRPIANMSLQEGLSTDARRVWAVFFQCNGVYAADVAAHSTRLPEPSLVKSTDDTCAVPQPVSVDPPVAKAVALYGHRLGILLPGTLPGTYAVWTGLPGDDFTEGPALPTSDSFVPEQIAADPYTGNVVAIGQGNDGTNEGVYETTLVADTWSNPRQIATLNSATDDFQIEAVSTFHRSTYVGLSRDAGLFIVHGTKSGQWGGAIRLAHSNRADTSLRLYTNPDTTHLHAAFTRHGSKKHRGVLQEVRGDHGWSKPKQFSHSGRDITQQITINPVGRAVVGYLHR